MEGRADLLVLALHGRERGEDVGRGRRLARVEGEDRGEEPLLLELEVRRQLARDGGVERGDLGQLGVVLAVDGADLLDERRQPRQLGAEEDVMGGRDVAEEVGEGGVREGALGGGGGRLAEGGQLGEDRGDVAAGGRRPARAGGAAQQ
jgi:hypothetical protein